MKLLVDMNLAPAWVDTLKAAGWSAAHWSALGHPRAADAEIMHFARAGDWVVFTHDLDFGTILAHTQAGRPSVFQVRAQDVSPDHLGSLVCHALRQFASELEVGALVTVDEARQRVRLLPLSTTTQ
jgi:predicted nuclease of predicted toxin-antitoxin system